MFGTAIVGASTLLVTVNGIVSPSVNPWVTIPKALRNYWRYEVPRVIIEAYKHMNKLGIIIDGKYDCPGQHGLKPLGLADVPSAVSYKYGNVDYPAICDMCEKTYLLQNGYADKPMMNCCKEKSCTYRLPNSAQIGAFNKMKAWNKQYIDRYEYMKWFKYCGNCINEQLPVNIVHKILEKANVALEQLINQINIDDEEEEEEWEEDDEEELGDDQFYLELTDLARKLGGMIKQVCETVNVEDRHISDEYDKVVQTMNDAEKQLITVHEKLYEQLDEKIEQMKRDGDCSDDYLKLIEHKRDAFKNKITREKASYDDKCRMDGTTDGVFGKPNATRRRLHHELQVLSPEF